MALKQAVVANARQEPVQQVLLEGSTGILLQAEELAAEHRQWHRR